MGTGRLGCKTPCPRRPRRRAGSGRIPGRCGREARRYRWRHGRPGRPFRHAHGVEGLRRGGRSHGHATVRQGTDLGRRAGTLEPRAARDDTGDPPRSRAGRRRGAADQQLRGEPLQAEPPRSRRPRAGTERGRSPHRPRGRRCRVPLRQRHGAGRRFDGAVGRVAGTAGIDGHRGLRGGLRRAGRRAGTGRCGPAVDRDDERPRRGGGRRARRAPERGATCRWPW